MSQVYHVIPPTPIRAVRDEDAPTYDGQPIRPSFTMMDTESHDRVAATLGAHTYSVFAYLCRRINAKTGECHPSVETISEATMVSRRQVQYALKELEQGGFVTRETRITAYGMTAGVTYRLPQNPRTNGGARAAHGPRTGRASPAPKLDVEPDENKRETTVSRAPKVETQEFATFYERYPRHVGRSVAWKAWQKLDPQNGSVEAIMSGLERLRPEYLAKESRFIPHPSTWLNEQRWTDELDSAKAKPSNDHKRHFG